VRLPVSATAAASESGSETLFENNRVGLPFV